LIESVEPEASKSLPASALCAALAREERFPTHCDGGLQRA